MRIYKAKDYVDMSRKAANIVSAQVIMKPNCVLGLATGSTPIGLYKQLVEWSNKGDLDFSEVMTVNLDEYKGLSRDNDQSYYYFMHQNLFDHVNIPAENTHLPNGMEPDSQKECQEYTDLIQSLGGVDLQLLGIGHNGHIGFNEPGEAFDKQVHCVNLTQSTIEANKRFFASADDVPKQAYTMGIKTIMQAKKILIVASGEDKAEIVRDGFMAYDDNTSFNRICYNDHAFYRRQCNKDTCLRQNRKPVYRYSCRYHRICVLQQIQKHKASGLVVFLQWKTLCSNYCRSCFYSCICCFIIRMAITFRSTCCYWKRNRWTGCCRSRYLCIPQPTADPYRITSRTEQCILV